MYSGQQNPQGYQQYPQPQPQYQQYPQQQPGYPPQYQQPPAQPAQPAPQPVPQAPPGPAKDTVVADEFKKYLASISWQVGDHQQYPGQHMIKFTPPANHKPVKGDVKKGQITIRAMGIPAPGAPPSGANSIQVNIDTEEKAGFFGSDKKSYPLWLNADEEVDANMQPAAGLKDKVRNIMTQAKIMMPPPPPPAAPPAPAPQQQWPQPQPGAPMQPAPQQPQAYPQQPAQPQYQQPAPQPAYQQPAPQPTYQQPAPVYQAQQAPQYQPQAAPQYQQPAPQYPQQPAQPQYGGAPGYGQKMCANPNCRTPNAPNATSCYRCGYQLQ